MRLGRASFAALFATALIVVSGRPACAGESAAQSSQVAGEAHHTQSSQSFGAVSAYEGMIVKSIDFRELPNSDQERLRQLIPQKIGEPLDRERLRQSIQALNAIGRFADISVTADRTPEGAVSLAFLTRANYFIGQVRVEGAPNPPAPNQIVNASKLQLGDLFTRERLERALQNINRLMEQTGSIVPKCKRKSRTTRTTSK